MSYRKAIGDAGLVVEEGADPIIAAAKPYISEVLTCTETGAALSALSWSGHHLQADNMWSLRGRKKTQW